MALNISANKDQLIVIDKNGNLKLINAGDKVLPGEILLNSDNENISSDTNEAPELQKQDKDIEEVLNAIVDGEDPSLVSEASAAGEDNGSSLTTSVEIERTGQDFIAKTDFDTSPLEAIGFSKIQSLTLLEQYIAYRESGSINGETLNVVDTRAPNAPTIALHTDSGTLGDDLLTNDGSFTVTPSEAGNTIEYFVDGEWTIEEPIATEGNNSITVRETDAAGNVSGETSLDFVLDTQAPNAPTITLDTDSGISNGDLLTNDGSFTVTPSEAGNTVEYQAADGSWSTTPPAVVEGDNSIVVREVDAAGNASGETSLDFVLDTQVPNAPTITLDTDSGISNGDLLTNDGSFTVTPSENGNTIEYQAADGSWSTTPPAVVEGDNSIVVRETDAAGNVSGETSLDFVLDTQAPNAPTITLDTDSGISNGDLLTNDGSFTVTPSEVGNTIEYQAADGSWSTTPPAVVEGDNSIVVRETDAAGNVSGETSLDFVLDTQAPNAPTITLDTDSGISNGDLLTNDGSFTVTPSEVGNTIEYQAADGSWSTTPPAVVEGDNSIVVREVDAAGNASGETSLDFVLDTQVPNAPTITLDTDSGMLGDDLLTNDGAFTVTPSEAGNTVEYQAADGSWSTTPPAVVEGNNSIVVRETDAAGNVSGETGLDFVLDTQAPNAPTITLDTDSGTSNGDLLTNDGSFTVAPSEAGNTVEYFVDGEWTTDAPTATEGDNSIVVREVDAAGNVSGETSLDFVLDTQAPSAPTITLDTDSGMLGDDLLTNDGSFTVTPSEAGNTVEYQAADGSWSTTPPAVVEGDNSIVVREVDAAGNASGETSLDFVLDTQAPNAPTITLDTDSGMLGDDLLTNDGSFTVTPSEAGNTVEYQAADGSWSTTPPVVVEGDNSIVVREVDAAGNVSGETSLDFVLDTQAPNAPTITLDTDSGISNGDLLTNDGSFTVTPSEAGNTVEYQAADGSWLTTPPAVVEGDNSIVVREVDAAGNVSGETSLDFVLDTQAPNAPTITLDTDSGISNGDLLTNDGSFTVTPSEAGNTVEYQAADGSWSTTPPAVVEGDNSIVVREVDAAGNVSGETSLDFVLDTQAPNAPTITLDTDSGISNGDLLTNDGSFTVTPSEAGNTVEYQAADGSWSTTPPAVVEGNNSIVVRETDAAGNVSGETSLDFVLDTQAPNAPTITLDTDSGMLGDDLLTNDGSFTVTPSEAGNTVEYQAADGSWSTTPPAVVEGDNSIVVREVDAAGNASGETSLDFVLDTQAPNAPTITLDTDSGISNGDLLTNDGSFTVTPSEAGNTVEYQAADGSWSTTPPAVVEGNNSIVVREVDAAGNVSGETSLDFVLDTQVPNAPTITLDTDSGISDGDLLTNDGSFTVTPSEAGNTVEYQAADGSWSTTPPAVVEGDNSIVVREVDAAGNASGETSLDFVLDTQAPNAPTITLDTDSGMLGDDLLTNDGSFTVTPSEAGNTVEYQAADGSWSTTPPAVVEGDNSIVVRETDAAGNVSGETSLDFVLDTQAPNAPTITLDTDSGMLGDDLLTNDGSFTVTPSEAGNTVEYQAADGSWSTTPPAVVEGNNSIVVREVDAAGNASDETSLDFVLDTQVPNAPTITLDTDSGIINGDLLTNDGSFTVTPSEAGNTVEYFVDGEWTTGAPMATEGDNSIVVREVDAAGNTSGETSLDFVLDTQVPNAPTITLDTDSGISNGDLLTNDGSFTVTPSEAGNTVEYQAADGSWSTTPPAVVEGNNSIVVREVDAAGNTSGETSLDFVLDTQVPNAPTITLDTDSGISNGDLLTNDGSFTVTPSEAGNTVEYQAADGSWSTTPPAVVEGNNSIVVREVDAAGNASGETSLDFVLDTQVPNAPTITLDTDSGISNGDLLTNDGSFTVTPSEAGNTVEYQAADGSWSTTPPAVVEGNNSIVVREVDAAGNASGETSLDFVLDTQAPNAPTITLDTDSGISDGDLLTNDGSFTVTPSEAGNTVEYQAADGSWSTTPPAVVEGNNSIVVREVDAAGNASGETSLDFVLDTQAPNAPTITDITDDSVNSDYSKITVHGSGEPGATITLYSQGNVWATTVVGEDGTWSVDYSGIPDSSDQILQVEQTDLSGNTSELSDPIQYFNSDYYGNSLDSDDYGFLGDGDDFFQAHNDDANDRVMFDGGAGNDTISFDSAFSDVQISINSDGDIVLVDREGDTNILRDFENFEFTDTTKTIEELTVPKVTIIDDANNDGILTKTELEGRITAVISIPSIAVAGMALLITIDGHTEEYILSEEDISSGVIVKEIDTPENNTEVNVSVDISYNGSVYSGEDSVIYVGNNEPTASNDIVNVLENNSILISKDMLLSNDIDADGDSLSIINIGSVNGGVASLDEHGNILFTPDLNFSGEVVFEYTIDDGYGGQSTAEITVNIDAVANTPNLIVENSDWSLSTGLENVDIPGPAPWYVAGLDGWRPSDGEPVIEIWVTGESMGYGATEGNGSIIVNPSEGNTIVELNKVENNEFSSAGGIQRDISTVEGKLYTISLDAAPRPGVGKEFNAFEVLIDGVVIGSWSADGWIGSEDIYDNYHTSLQWDDLQFSFIGSGNETNIEIRASGEVNSNGRGTLIDNIVIDEHNGVQAGNNESSTEIILSNYISGSLSDTDGSESLSYEISNLPDEVQVFVDGVALPIIDGTVVITAEQLASAKMVFDVNYKGLFTLSVTAIATETSNGSIAKSEPKHIDFIVADKNMTTDVVKPDVLSNGDFVDSVQVIFPGTAYEDTNWATAGSGKPSVNLGINETKDGLIVDVGAAGDDVYLGSGNDIIYLGDSYASNYDGDLNDVKVKLAQSLLDDVFSKGSDLSHLQGGIESGGFTTLTAASNAYLDIGHGGDGNDMIFGQGGIDVIFGGAGDDYLDGGNGNDGLRGGTGNDHLLGGEGNDILIGGLGDDILVGGIGDDIFKWVDQGADSGIDTITDFTKGEDLIDITEILNDDVHQNDLNDLLEHITISEDGDDLTLSITDDAGKDHTIVVEGGIGSFGLDNANFSNQAEILTKLLDEQLFKLDDTI